VQIKISQIEKNYKQCLFRLEQQMWNPASWGPLLYSRVYFKLYFNLPVLFKQSERSNFRWDHYGTSNVNYGWI